MIMMSTIDFEAGGKSYSMRMTTNAQVRYQRAAGETLLRGLSAIQEDPSDTERLRRLIWASMSHIDGITEDDAGDIMDALGIEVAITKLSDAVTAAYPKASADAGNGGRAKKSPK
jgi:hypothetical protein